MSRVAGAKKYALLMSWIIRRLGLARRCLLAHLEINIVALFKNVPHKWLFNLLETFFLACTQVQFDGVWGGGVIRVMLGLAGADTEADTETELVVESE